VVVSDYQMPVMDGLEFLEELRKQNNDIPFIVFTGKGREEVAVDAFHKGADGYVLKGRDPTSQYAELTNYIRQTFNCRKMESALRESEERFRAIILPRPRP
jgi:CheY-like chemotaxis protein